MSSELPLQRPPERRFWYLKTPEGSVFGPAAWDQLRRWVEQGRVTADCQLASGEGRIWQSADAVFAELTVRPAIPIHPAEPLVPATIAETTDPSSQANSSTPAKRIELPTTPDGRPFLRKHRGGLILVLGLLGLLVACPILSLMAWVMGSEDLRAIDEGKMDPAGRQQTLVGQRFGMVISLVWIVGCVLTLFGMLLIGS